MPRTKVVIPAGKKVIMNRDFRPTASHGNLAIKATLPTIPDPHFPYFNKVTWKNDVTIDNNAVVALPLNTLLIVEGNLQINENALLISSGTRLGIQAEKLSGEGQIVLAAEDGKNGEAGDPGPDGGKGSSGRDSSLQHTAGDGTNGKKGGPGDPGQDGEPGQDAGLITITTNTYEGVLISANGGNGGNGGRGGDGGKGGRGGNGGKDCWCRDGGNGGNGGDGGDGGDGGNGGDGGDGGEIHIRCKINASSGTAIPSVAGGHGGAGGPGGGVGQGGDGGSSGGDGAHSGEGGNPGSRPGSRGRAGLDGARGSYELIEEP